MAGMAPIVGLAIVGLGISLYLGLYQVDVFERVWEPFFGDGSAKILNSEISHVLPIPDALLGAFAYLVDVVSGVIGSTKRWRTMPWIVVAFGLAVGPLGFISVMLVVFQPVLLDAFSTLCLASAVVSIGMIGPAVSLPRSRSFVAGSRNATGKVGRPSVPEIRYTSSKRLPEHRETRTRRSRGENRDKPAFAAWHQLRAQPFDEA